MMKSRQATKTGPEAAAREQLSEIAAEVEAIRFRLLGVHASLPPDGSSLEIRTVIECLLADAFGPALRDLRTLADGPP